MPKIQNLPYPDRRHLEAADGWLGLGCWREAGEELDRIEPEYHSHPFVLELRFKVYSEARCWDKALETARSLLKTLPDNQWGHFYTAYALHELKRTQEAYDVLQAVIRKFPKHQSMHFNLACYSCVLGRKEEAMQWLKKAVDMPGEPDIREIALKDHDLEPLWAQIREI